MVKANIIISGVGKYIPKNSVDNDYFIEHFRKEENGSIEVEGLMKKLGRDKRHIAERGESSLSMGYKAAINLINKYRIKPTSIDMIVFASETPEYTSPTNALILNNMLGAKNAHVVHDMNSNCTSMLVALDNVSCIMKAKPEIKRALIVGCFYASSVVRFNDSIAYPCFGDGASSVLLDRVESEQEEGVLTSRYVTDSNFKDYIKLPACGQSNAMLGKYHKYYQRLEWLPFDSSCFSEHWVNMINSIFAEYNITDDNVAYYAFSQFSNAENVKTLKKLGIESTDKYLFNGTEYGYTGCSSPIIALNDVWDKAKDMKGKYIMFVSVAAGLSFCVVLYKI